jgi:hypothetical protein
MTQPVRVGQVWRHATSPDPNHDRLVEVTQVSDVFVRVHGQRHSTMPVGSLLRRYELVTDAPPEDEPLLDARPLYAVREQVMEDRHAGTTCPACGQYAKVYRRKLTAATAAVLIRMYRMTTNDPLTYIYLPSLREVNKGGDVAKARFWGLIDAPTEAYVREDGSPRIGMWRLTPLGRSFVEGQVVVPKYALIYNGELLGLEDDEMEDEAVTIRDVLGTRFDYRALMQGV